MGWTGGQLDGPFNAHAAIAFDLGEEFERVRGTLYTKPVSEDMGPAEIDCPARILDVLTAPSNDYATEWRARCRARLARTRPRSGDTVVFAAPIAFTDGERHQRLTFSGGSRFTSADGRPYYVTKWSQLDYAVEPAAGNPDPRRV